MFSKALFKQSMKAHWVKWLSVTLSTCIMLAIVIIVLGNLGINDIRDSLQDVFTQADQESVLKENAVDGYEVYLTSVELEGTLQNADESMLKMAYPVLINPFNTRVNAYKEMHDGQEPEGDDLQAIILASAEEVKAIIGSLGGEIDIIKDIPEDMLLGFLVEFYNVYNQNPFSQDDEQFKDKFVSVIKDTYLNFIYTNAYNQYMEQEGATVEIAEYSAAQMKTIITNAMASYQAPVGEFDREPYKAKASEEINMMMYNVAYQTIYAQSIAGGMTEEEAQTYSGQYAVASKVLSNTAISTYELWLNELKDVEDAKTQAREYAIQSITDQIPEKVAEALSELGNMDIYSFIIGSIFYRIAGLLPPMVFVIMTANSLLAGQVDSGSMAYVLSTPTKRRTVTVTQMTYLILALFSMFALLTVTSVIAVWVSGGNSFAINYGQILLFNLGAFLTMFAIAGFCFMCSAVFNRTKYSLGIGGGLTIFSLVCTILGLFGSSVVPSAMRISAMNFFNYLSFITLFDTVSIMSGGLDYLWKFGILLGIGIVTFIIGVFRFDKKDLPL